jgi:hypothetical protein
MKHPSELTTDELVAELRRHASLVDIADCPEGSHYILSKVLAKDFQDVLEEGANRLTEVLELAEMVRAAKMLHDFLHKKDLSK